MDKLHKNANRSPLVISGCQPGGAGKTNLMLRSTTLLNSKRATDSKGKK